MESKCRLRTSFTSRLVMESYWRSRRGELRRWEEIEIEQFGGDTVVLRHGGIEWACSANIRPSVKAGSVYDRSLSAFREADKRLRRAGFRFDNVIRTWLYLGDITGKEGESQRYRELNKARADFYRDLKFGGDLTPCPSKKPVYPASTGIGAEGKDIMLSCLALRGNRKDVMLVPLENPKQTSAYDYAHEYGADSPKFARAMAVATGEFIAAFISGTASITASETRHVDDFEGQTQQTLDNIEALISAENFRNHGLSGVGLALDNLAMARVYMKRPEDYARVRAICRKRLGELPTIYVVADICRPELFVEIEGVAFSRIKAGSIWQ